MNEFDRLFELFKSKYAVSNDTALLCTVLTCRNNEYGAWLEDIQNAIADVSAAVNELR